MSKTMLIDASHPEETRVAVVDGNRLQELDFESAAKRQIRGNVYLARVTRVEPSLQAAFVEFGGNRHGFLAFSEIHPDYYQIPYEDRQALLEAEHEESLKQEEEDEEELEQAEAKADLKEVASEDADETEEEAEEAEEAEETTDTDEETDAEEETSGDEDVVDAEEEEIEAEQEKMTGARRKRMARRRYKIQEVIKRGQILLIQAVKEERGNKGAAVTTYLSLAGRYCVLMPNTPRGGGISRKIANGGDRKRLKKIMSELSVPKGMGLIVRTAGAKRTKAEIKRDYTYLSKLWDTIRDTTLHSIAPALIHEEGNLVKRSIRDLYGKDIDKVLVQGEQAYKTAKNFMKLLMPSHAKNVQHYKDDIPLFLRYQVENQIEACLEPVVQLKSGGYLVIHPTEALVSIDVNSGRSTKERNVERTALKTNLEAAEEVARQMRLRDLAGLVVIDFIDMDHQRNNKAVERRLREALASDRARVQMGRISQFGLMELSRQRRRRSLLEGSSASCEHCGGVGRKRSVESSALKAVRAVEEEAIRGRSSRIRLYVTPDVAAYLLNEKRDLLNNIEDRTGMFTEVESDASLLRPAFKIERLEKKADAGPDPIEQINREFRQAAKQSGGRRKSKKQDKDAPEVDETKETSPEAETEDKPAKPKRRRGRRGGRRRRGNKREEASTNETAETTQDTDTPSAEDNALTKEASDKVEAKVEDKVEDKPGKTKSRRRKTAPKADDKAKDENVSESDTPEGETPDVNPADAEKEQPAKKPSRKRTSRKSAKKTEETVDETALKDVSEAEEGTKAKKSSATKTKPKATGKAGKSASVKSTAKTGTKAAKDTQEEPVEKATKAEVKEEKTGPSADGAKETVPSESVTAQKTEAPAEAKPKEKKKPTRRGWWQRRK